MWLNNVVRGGDKPGDQPVYVSTSIAKFLWVSCSDKKIWNCMEMNAYALNYNESYCELLRHIAIHSKGFIFAAIKSTFAWRISKVCFRALNPHLDYYQDDEARLEYHKTFPLIDLAYSDKNVSEGHVLTGYYDTEDLRVGVMLGVWKPLNPNQVNNKHKHLYVLWAHSSQVRRSTLGKNHSPFRGGV